MTLLTRDQLEQLKRDNPCDQVAAQWVSLRKGGKLGLVGPCPIHSPDPQARDSTRFECDRDRWLCVECGGGDVIRLVALRNGLDPDKDFRRAITLPQGGLLRPFDGAPAAPLSAEEEKALAEARAEEQAHRQRETNEFRDRERRSAWDIYYGRAGVWETFRLRHPKARPALDYLALRLGGPADWHKDLMLRFNPASRFYVPDRPRAREIHRGPALLGLIQRDGHFAGVHQTYLDLVDPKGKARIVDPKTQDAMNAKKVRGSQKGGHVFLYGAREPDTVVLGEGIEKTLAVLAALIDGGRPIDGWAFWSGMNLDNMGGKHADVVPHPELHTQTGRRRRVPGPVPDLASPGILIPASVKRVILLGDTTSDAFTTQCTMARAAARFKAQREDVDVQKGEARLPLQVDVAWGPDGKDFDDVLREAG